MKMRSAGLRRSVVAACAATAVCALAAPAARAVDGPPTLFCNTNLSTPAQGYCWEGHRHTWDRSHAVYLGGGWDTFQICAVLQPYYSPNGGTPPPYGFTCGYGVVQTCYPCGTKANTTVWLDAGVYNGSVFPHTVYGLAEY